MEGKFLIDGEVDNDDEDGNNVDSDDNDLLNVNDVDSKYLKCLPPFVTLCLVFSLVHTT